MPPTAAKNRSLLLKDLAIERDVVAIPANRPRRLLISIVTGILSVSMLLGWLYSPSIGDSSTKHLTSSPSAGTDAESAHLAAALHAPPALTTPASSLAPVASVLDASGYVVARLAATVSSKTTGKIVEVLIEEGMAVEKGQIMALLDDRSIRARLALATAELHATRAIAGELKSQVIRAQLDLDRALTLVAKKMVSQAHLDALSATLNTLLAQSNSANQAIEVSQRKLEVHQVALDDLTIRAPFKGVVISKSAQPGEMISPVSAGGGFTRTGIGTIVDMDSLEVQVDVNESYIDRVQPGQKVRINLNAYPDQAYEGFVLAVIPTANRSKATIRVRVQFVATDQRVLPEMGVRVAFL